jgi:hypothetical protein
VRPITIDVTDETVGSAVVWGYPRDDVPQEDIGPLYEVPTYKIIVRGTFDDGTSAKREFEAIRFGVQQKTTQNRPRVVGLAHEQTHIVKQWLPNYAVHSASSEERGAWQVIEAFLIHDGPDNPLDRNDPYASIGCVELCGPRGFIVFNQYLVSLSGTTSSGLDHKLAEIGDSKMLRVHYAAASRPPVKPFR